MNGHRRPAALGRRVLAVVIDGAVMAAVVAAASGALVTLSVATSGAVSMPAAVLAVGVVALAWFGVQTAMQGARGSLGMRAAGIRLAYANDEQALGFGRALGRNLIWAATAGIVVGCFSPLFDPSPWRRGWHDLATGAVMADASAVPAGAPVVSRPLSSPEVSQAPRLAAPVGGVPIDRSALAVAMPLREAAAATEARAVSLRESVQVGAPAPAHPSSWAPPRRPPARTPRTLPVDVISTIPGVPNRSGIRPAGPDTAPPPTLAMLVWDDGTRHTVFDATLFGRSPAGEAGKRLTAVRDETLSISKTHFEIGADEQSTWIIDRHSLNGVVIIRGGVPQRIAPGEPARLWSGDVLDVGDRKVTVESAR